MPQCRDEVWEDPKTNIRLFPKVRRDSEEWDKLYARRQSVETGLQVPEGIEAAGTTTAQGG